MTNKKFLILLLALALITPMYSIKGETVDMGTYRSEKLNDKEYSAGYSVGTPILQTQLIDARFNVEDGVNTLYSSSMGTPAVFNVYDLDHKKVLRSFELAGCTSVWTHGIDSQGNVYIATQDSAILYRYSSITKNIAKLGSIMSQTACYDMVIDENDNVYVGTYPSGTVVKYNPNTNSFSSYTAPLPGNKYIRSLGYYNGNLYAGTLGTVGQFYKINTSSGVSTQIALPTSSSYGACENIYNISVVRNYVFLSCNMVNSAKVMLIYNAETGTFLSSFSLSAQGGYVTPELDGKAYYTAGGYLQQFNLDTGTLTQTSTPFNYYNRGSAWLDITTESGYTGKTLVSVIYGGYPIYFNLATKKSRTLTECSMVSSGIQLHNLTYNQYSNKVYTSGYVANSGAEYNVSSDTLSSFSMGQAENMYDDGESMYFGIYPGGKIYKANVSNNSVARPTELFTIGDEQDRPYVIKGGDNKLFIGTIPDYGQIGGALTIYDKTTATYDVYRNIVQNQSIVGLAYQDGLVYGSTSITPGLGIDPTESEARMFVFDVKTKTKVKEFIPNFPLDKVPGPIKQIGDLQFGPDGLLWGAVRSYVFALDPDTLEIKKEVLLNSFTWGSGVYWRPIFLRFASDGTLYVSDNGINIIDINTMEVMNLREYTGVEGSLLALDNNDNVYTSSGSKLIKVPAIKATSTDFIKVPNGAFEADAVGDNGTITNWTNLNPNFVASSSLSYGIATKAYSSTNTTNQALKLYDNSSTGFLAIGSEKINVTPGTAYKFMFDYITERGIYYSVNFYNAEGKVYQKGSWLNPLEGNIYGLNNNAAANLVLAEPASTTGNKVFLTYNTESVVAPADATQARITFATTEARAYNSYIDNVKLAIAYDEKPTNEEGKHYLNVPNPGFERGEIGKNGTIPGWSLMGVPEGTSIIDENLYYAVYDNYGKNDATRGLYLYDLKNVNSIGNGINIVSDKIYLPPAISGKEMTYTLEFDYNTTRQASSLMNFYNASGQVWNGSAWKNVINAYNDYVAADLSSYKSYDYYEAAVSSGGPGLNIWSKRTRSLTAPAGTVAIRLGFLVSPYFTSALKVDNVKLSYVPTYLNMSVATLTNGAVSTAGGIVSTSGNVATGETFTLTATPASGYVIGSITYDGVIVVTNHNGEYTYQTPTLSEAKSIEVNFISDVAALKVDTLPVVYDYLDTVNNSPTGITFATAKNTYGTYNLIEYGMVFSFTDANPEIGKESCIKAKGITARNTLGQYGIQFIGKKLEFGKTYYTKSYGIYSNGTEQITVYGSATSFTPKNSALN